MTHCFRQVKNFALPVILILESASKVLRLYAKLSFKLGLCTTKPKRLHSDCNRAVYRRKYIENLDWFSLNPNFFSGSILGSQFKQDFNFLKSHNELLSKQLTFLHLVMKYNQILIIIDQPNLT